MGRRCWDQLEGGCPQAHTLVGHLLSPWICDHTSVVFPRTSQRSPIPPILHSPLLLKSARGAGVAQKQGAPQRWGLPQAWESASGPSDHLVWSLWEHRPFTLYFVGIQDAATDAWIPLTDDGDSPFIRRLLAASLKTNPTGLNKRENSKEQQHGPRAQFPHRDLSVCCSLPPSGLPSASGRLPPLLQTVDSKQNRNKTVLVFLSSKETRNSFLKAL